MRTKKPIAAVGAALLACGVGFFMPGTAYGDPSAVPSETVIVDGDEVEFAVEE